MKKCNACGAGPRTCNCPAILPLSYGPDAMCLRMDAGVIIVPWVLLASELTGDPKALVTVHQQTNGTLRITHEAPGQSVQTSNYTARAFADLCARIGQDSKRPTN